ncbi:MAG: FHA domain-containing protein [Verrucomicrobiia bacterium]|jgi:pSer/pThr/pTyr-binding forkhead associated (FHA) protein
MNENIENWLRRAGPTLDAALDAPRGLYDRLKYVAEIIRDAGELPSQPHLFYRGTDNQVHAVLVGQEVAVGREPPSSHVINDPKLSRRHFCVCIRSESAIITDLHSRNGTYVNGEKTRERELCDGDIIEAGSQVLVFLRGDTEAREREME